MSYNWSRGTKHGVDWIRWAELIAELIRFAALKCWLHLADLVPNGWYIWYGWSSKIGWLKPAFYQIWFYHEYNFVLSEVNSERLKNQLIWSDSTLITFGWSSYLMADNNIADLADLVIRYDTIEEFNVLSARMLHYTVWKLWTPKKSAKKLCLADLLILLIWSDCWFGWSNN